MADKEREIGMREEEIEVLLKQLKDAKNPDLRVELARHIKPLLDKLEMEVGSRGVEKYYRQLNRAFGETLEEVVPSEEGEGELPKELIIEGKKRVAVFTTAEKMFDRLEVEKDPETRETIAKEIEEFLEENEDILMRSDKSGANDLRNFRLQLDNLRPRMEEKEEAA